MRLPASSPLQHRWPLLGLAVFFIFLLAASALLWTSAGPASGQDGHVPDPELVDDVWGYAKETEEGPPTYCAGCGCCTPSANWRA